MYLFGTKQWNNIKYSCSYSKFFFFLKNISFDWNRFCFRIPFVLCHFPPIDFYIFRILLLSTAEREAWMSSIPSRSCESLRQIFLAAAADQSGGILITGVLPRPRDWFPAGVPVGGRHRAALVVCRARACIVCFFYSS